MMYKKIFGLVIVLGLCACASEKEKIEGVRESVLTPMVVSSPNAGIKIKLPRPNTNELWSQSGGNSQHFMGHLAAPDNLKEKFDISFGSGDSKRDFLISSPVIAHGVVFAIDADAKVSAYRLDDGRKIWHKKLKPDNKEDEEISMKGAGIAVYDNKVFATTGFGSVFALDMKTGKKLWHTDLKSPIRIAPTVNNNRLFVQTIDNLLISLDTKTGEEHWRHQAALDATILVGGASSAYANNEDILVAAFSTGQLQAFKASTGSVLWTDYLVPKKRNDSLSSINTIKANPIIDGEVVYVVGHNNIFVAIDLRSGQRIWEKEVGSINQPWLAGSYLYLITTDLDLMAIEAKSGKTVWSVKIPNKDGTSRAELNAGGPILVYNRLMLATSNGYIFSASPYTGEILGYTEISDGVEISPIVAGQIVVFTTKDADLVVYK